MGQETQVPSKQRGGCVVGGKSQSTVDREDEETQ